MNENQKISICIPTYSRYEMVLESISKVVDDFRIDEIIIVDDCSTDGSYEKLLYIPKSENKVKIFRNSINLDCYKNKHRAISLASNGYVIILDSDNIIDISYLDRLFEQEWNPNTILAPTFAKPSFDYRELNGIVATRNNVASLMSLRMFPTALNTFNYFIHRDNYLNVFDGSVDPVTADSIYFNYCWLKSGRSIKFVDGLQYDHRIHAGSHYQINNHKTGNFYEEVVDKLKQLS